MIKFSVSERLNDIKKWYNANLSVENSPKREKEFQRSFNKNMLILLDEIVDQIRGRIIT